jgi:hypothetical protein
LGEKKGLKMSETRSFMQSDEVTVHVWAIFIKSARKPEIREMGIAKKLSRSEP